MGGSNCQACADQQAGSPFLTELNSIGDTVPGPAYTVISRLVDKGRTWVKISGAYMDTKVGPPTYADSTRLAQAFVKLAPQRMVWGSDWPHPTAKDDDKPNDATLVDLLAEWAPDEATRRRILVENPAELYGYTQAI